LKLFVGDRNPGYAAQGLIRPQYKLPYSDLKEMTCEYLFALESTAISVRRASFAIDVAHVVSNDGIDRDKLTFWRFSTVERGLKISKYWSSNCQQCALKGHCTPGPQRRVTRWEHESVLDEMQARLGHAPEMMRIRRQTVEHPFGTIKAWMGAIQFQTRPIERVSTEMSFHARVQHGAGGQATRFKSGYASDAGVTLVRGC
jgi:hypothetical protein